MGDEAKKAIATQPRKQSSPPLPPVQPLARAIITVLEYGTGKPLSGVRVEIWGKIFCSKESSPGVYPSDFPFTPGDAPVKLSKPGYGAVPKTTDKEAEPEYVETKPFPVGTSKYTFHLIDKSKAILVVTAQTPRREAIPDAAVDLWNIDSIKTKSDGKVEYLVDLKTVSTRTPDNKLSVKVGKEDYGANTDPFVVPTLFEDKPWTPIPGARHE